MGAEFENGLAPRVPVDKRKVEVNGGAVVVKKILHLLLLTIPYDYVSLYDHYYNKCYFN